MLDKQTIEQYAYIQDEIHDIQKKMKHNEESITKLIEEGTVCDHVTGGLGGIQGFHIEGFPIKEYERRRKLLQSQKARLDKKQNDLLEKSEQIEMFIDKIPNSRDRLVLRKRIIEKSTQDKIAKEIHVERSLISKIVSKYIKWQVSHNSQKNSVILKMEVGLNDA